MALKLMPTTTDTAPVPATTAPAAEKPASRPKPAMAPRPLGKAAKAASKAPKAAAVPKAPKAPKPLGKRAQAEADAAAGKFPKPPNCDLASNTRHRPKLAKLNELIAAGDIEGLRTMEIKLVSSMPIALDRYRSLAITALEARAAKAAKPA